MYLTVPQKKSIEMHIHERNTFIEKIAIVKNALQIIYDDVSY